MQRKTEVLAGVFSRASQSRHLPEDVARYRAEEESRFETPVMDNSTPFNGDPTLKELKTAISGLGTASKATGEDLISYHMIRRFTKPMTKTLLKFYQTCWESGTVPSAWTEALVVVIPKDRKPRHLPTSYRPIALTPHLGKVYERLVKNRLEYFLEKQYCLYARLGFGKAGVARSTLSGSRNMSKKALTAGLTTVATFFDIKRAFDTVWHAKLLDKMQALGITGRMYQFVQTFLDSRRMAVKVGHAKSQTHTLDMGVPQGSVIAPTLFSLMLHDIQTVGSPRLSMSLYADDLAIWGEITTKQHKRKWMAKYQECTNRIHGYMRCNGFELCAEKTALMVFTRQIATRGDYSIRTGDKVIQPSMETRFLGVALDQSLSWRAHTKRLITKARRATSLIKLLRGETWATPRSLIHLTGALVRSRLTYGEGAYFTITDNEWLDLERAELAALKMSLGVPRYAVNDLVYQEAGWLPLREECRLRCAHFEARCSATPNTVRESLGKDFACSAKRNSVARKHPRVFRTTAPPPPLHSDG